jgi:hypothetical protein
LPEALPEAGTANETTAAERLRAALTNPLRRLPDFLIVGTQKGGTTFLYRYLGRHPKVRPAATKEVHYFDLNYGKGLGWYRSHFPLPAPPGRGFLTGEATPYYLFHPHAPARAARTVPGARLILLLRDPVDRAYSHYQHRVRKGIETLGFEDAVEAEGERLRGELERMLQDERYVSFNHQHFSYLSRGVYADQIPAWAERFGEDRMLVLKTEDLFERPAPAFRRVLDFLGLPPWRPRSFKVRDSGSGAEGSAERYPPMNPGTRRRLAGHFRPHNARLYEYLGRDLGW